MAMLLLPLQAGALPVSQPPTPVAKPRPVMGYHTPIEDNYRTTNRDNSNNILKSSAYSRHALAVHQDSLINMVDSLESKILAAMHHVK
jgi:hypothetical protein